MYINGERNKEGADEQVTPTISQQSNKSAKIVASNWTAALICMCVHRYTPCTYSDRLTGQAGGQAIKLNLKRRI